MSGPDIYRPVAVAADTLSRIWGESLRFFIYRGEMELQRGDRIRLEPNNTSDGPAARSLLVLVSFVSSLHQPPGQYVVGFETIEHYSDEMLHSLDAAGWHGRARHALGAYAKTRPHPQQTEIDDLIKKIRYNGSKNAPIAMKKRRVEFCEQLRAICPNHPVLSEFEND